LLIYIREPFLKPATINILNAGAPAGSSRALGFELIKYGFTVDKMENAPTDEKSETSYIDAYERDEDNATFLSETLKLTLRPLQDDKGIVAGTGTVLPITVTLGKDYVYTSVADLLSESITPQTSSSSLSAPQ